MRAINADKLYPDRMTDKGLAISQSQIANAQTLKINEWIPLTTRPMTEDEKESFSNDELYSEAEIFNCKLPEDGQEVLVTVNGWVATDVFCRDGNNCYFEAYEMDDVIAWMPLPEPYIGESE